MGPNIKYTFGGRGNRDVTANDQRFRLRPIVLLAHIPETENEEEIEMNGLDMVLKYTDQSEIPDDVYAIPPPNDYLNRDTSAVSLDCYPHDEKTKCNVHCLVYGL